METENGKSHLPRGIGWGIFTIVVIFLGGIVFVFRNAPGVAEDALQRNLNSFQKGVKDLKSFNVKLAEDKFSSISGGVGGVNDIFGKLGSIFSGAGEAFSNFQNIASEGVILAQETQFLIENFFNLFLNNGGETILEHLEKIHSSLLRADEESRKLVSAGEGLGDASPALGKFYLPLGVDAKRFSSFFDALLPWLSPDGGRRIILMLQNSSEIRPAGGFLGSYADVFIKNGALESFDVRDINDVDRTLEANIVPPRPIQVIAKAWSAADSNWFFDFTSSAKKVIEFFELSGLYNDVDFSGAIATSPRVLGDILTVVGSAELKSRKLTLDKDNFLIELQKIVQEGQAAKATYPKAVLKELAPILIEKISTLSDEKKNRLWGFVGNWIKNKDLIFYFEDGALQNFAAYYGATGEVYDLSDGFNGDYLAIVDANIDGGKSDLFIKQEVLLESQINLDGTVGNHLVINRAHEGNKSKYWWYKETNQNYLQIFLPQSVRVTNFSGGVDKKIIPKANYYTGGYVADLLVSEIEATEENLFNFPAVRAHSESGKKVFSTWSATKAGAKTKIVFDYVTRASLSPEDGILYQFIFEKQAGTNRNYKFQINAPVGFRFRENGLPVFTYESNDPPGRLILDLTLEKI